VSQAGGDAPGIDKPGIDNGPARKRPGSRKLARELAVQGLYAWRMSGCDVLQVLDDLAVQPEYKRADVVHLRLLMQGVSADAATLEARIAPHLDRAPGALSPVERAILLIGAYELSSCPDVPYRVAINEAVELAKKFGGTDGHKYVNGVLDKLAPLMRPGEARGRGG
jgi:N utilization substance protein B